MIYLFLPAVPVEPIGGVQTIFDYAERLNELSQKTIATVVCPTRHIRGLLPRTYPLVQVIHQTPVFHPSDIIIFPEVLLDMFEQFPAENKKYLAVLNWQFFEEYLQRLPRQAKPKLSSLTGILTNSRYNMSKIEQANLSVPITFISHVIERRFHSTMSFQKRAVNSILILNRKNTHHLPGILAFLQQTPHQVTLVNNIAQEKLISLYNQHQIVLNLGYPEGFCRPAAEAMACGCVVVGFTGGGGTDFMKDGVNSFIAPDGDEEKLLQVLSSVLHERTRDELAIFSQNARNMIATTYTPAAQAQILYKIFRDEVAKKYAKKEVDQLYARLQRKPIAQRKVSPPLYAKISKDTLQLQLHHERQKYKEITSSRFFALWQGYCAVRKKLSLGVKSVVTLSFSR